MITECVYIGCKDESIRADAQHKRRILLEGIQGVVALYEQEHRECSLYLVHEILDYLLHILARLEMKIEVVWNNFGIGLGDKSVTSILKHFLEFLKILDNTVVDGENGALGIVMGMRIHLGYSPVGGPPRVGDSQGCLDTIRPPQGFDVSGIFPE